MRPLRVLALDLSLRATGLAVTHDQVGEPRLSCRTITPPRSASSTTAIDHPRLHQTFAAMAAALACKPDLVVIEWLPQFTGHGDATLRLAELHGALKHFLYAKGHRYVDVKPAHLKTWATGKGNATKVAVREAITARYGSHLHVGSEDEADAVALLTMALHAFGQPIGPTPPQANLLAVRKTDWPTLSEGAL